MFKTNKKQTAQRSSLIWSIIHGGGGEGSFALSLASCLDRNYPPCSLPTTPLCCWNRKKPAFASSEAICGRRAQRLHSGALTYYTWLKMNAMCVFGLAFVPDTRATPSGGDMSLSPPLLSLGGGYADIATELYTFRDPHFHGGLDGSFVCVFNFSFFLSSLFFLFFLFCYATTFPPSPPDVCPIDLLIPRRIGLRKGKRSWGQQQKIKVHASYFKRFAIDLRALYISIRSGGSCNRTRRGQSWTSASAARAITQAAGMLVYSMLECTHLAHVRIHASI